jgi:hypothetical protein
VDQSPKKIFQAPDRGDTSLSAAPTGAFFIFVYFLSTGWPVLLIVGGHPWQLQEATLSQDGFYDELKIAGIFYERIVTGLSLCCTLRRRGHAV